MNLKQYLYKHFLLKKMCQSLLLNMAFCLGARFLAKAQCCTVWPLILYQDPFYVALTKTYQTSCKNSYIFFYLKRSSFISDVLYVSFNLFIASLLLDLSYSIFNNFKANKFLRSQFFHHKKMENQDIEPICRLGHLCLDYNYVHLKSHQLYIHT